MAINEQVIVGGVSQLQVHGDEHGLMPFFNVYLTNGASSLYNRMNFEFERALGPGMQKEATKVLINCAHVCAYNTFNGIQTSPEWAGLIQPMVENPADKVRASVAVCNALGWAKWSVQEINADQARFVAERGYESEYYAKHYGKSDHPVCYVLAGVASALMDLSFGLPFPDGMYTFDTEEVACHAMGSQVCEFVTRRVNR